jgi:hypothetical protein
MMFWYVPDNTRPAVDMHDLGFLDSPLQRGNTFGSMQHKERGGGQGAYS